MLDGIIRYGIVSLVLGVCIGLAWAHGSIYGESMAYARMSWHCERFEVFMAGPDQGYVCQPVDMTRPASRVLPGVR